MTPEEQKARQREKNRARYQANLEYYRAKAREQRERLKAASPQFRVRATERVRAYRARHKDRLAVYFRDNLLQKKYGISFDDLQRMLRDQGFACATCFTAIDEVTRHVDHCHKSGKVRGLLCHNCNVILGLAHDSPDILRNLASYLNPHAISYGVHREAI